MAQVINVKDRLPQQQSVRRILQSSGIEVIHLGHNRSVQEIVEAAIQEDAHGIAISSYQGGHVEYFKYMVDMLRDRGRADINVFGGGGGVIIAEEIRELESHGVTRIYSPGDGQRMGLQGMIDDMIARCSVSVDGDQSIKEPGSTDHVAIAKAISQIENASDPNAFDGQLDEQLKSKPAVPVLGITGTGGSGKSSLTDELVLRFRQDYGEDISIAILAVDPTRRKTGGALLGDRIRMNAIDASTIFMRSLATRDAIGEVPEYLPAIIKLCKLSGFDLVVVETPGIGQGDAAIVPLVDASLYVMTPEFGAASQLEKIDMLDFADVVAINKFDRRGAEDALRDVRKQVQRNREAFTESPDTMPVFGTMAARFNDDGVTAMYQRVRDVLFAHGLKSSPTKLPVMEISASRARQTQRLRASAALLSESGGDAAPVETLAEEYSKKMSAESHALLAQWTDVERDYSADSHVSSIGGRTIENELIVTTLSGTQMRRISLPKYHDQGDLLAWMMRENLPGYFPFTAGVFPFKRLGEDPTRMFAGEGDAFRTNKRFKYLSQHSDAKRLSTAFDSVTLYGFDPAERPDIYGKVGNSGVSIATLDDMKALYDGFDLCSPKTSVSMTINGPAPTILAMFLNAAIDQQLVTFQQDNGREPTPIF